MTWLILTIISAVTGALTQILQKVLLNDKQSDPVTFAFIFQLSVAGLFLVYTVLTGTFDQPSLQGLIPNILIMTLFYCVGNLFTFKAFKLAEASEVSVIFASSAIWSAMSAMALLGEKLNTAKISGILIVLSGVIFINLKKSKWNMNKGHLFAFFGAMLFGLAFTNDAYIIERYNDISSYMVLAFAFPAIASLLFKPSAISSVKYFLEIKTFAKMLFCGLFYAISAIAIFTAYKMGGQASIISSVQKTSLIFTVAMGYLFLGERDNMRNKLIGTGFAFTGVLLLI